MRRSERERCLQTGKGVETVAVALWLGALLLVPSPSSATRDPALQDISSSARLGERLSLRIEAESLFPWPLFPCPASCRR